MRKPHRTLDSDNRDYGTEFNGSEVHHVWPWLTNKDKSQPKVPT